MKKIILEMFLIVTFSLCISLLYNMLSPSGLRILPKKKPIEGSMHMTDRMPIYAQAQSDAGRVR
jgi:hypothetical protein